MEHLLRLGAYHIAKVVQIPIGSEAVVLRFRSRPSTITDRIGLGSLIRSMSIELSQSSTRSWPTSGVKKSFSWLSGIAIHVALGFQCLHSTITRNFFFH
jgi:hypothetical protein